MFPLFIRSAQLLGFNGHTTYIVTEAQSEAQSLGFSRHTTHLVTQFASCKCVTKVKKQSDSLKPTIKPLSDSILKHGLLKQKDKDVRLLVVICICEILQILAPEPGFSDEDFRDIFQLLLGMFAELADTKSPYYSRRVELLETIAKYNFCV